MRRRGLAGVVIGVVCGLTLVACGNKPGAVPSPGAASTSGTAETPSQVASGLPSTSASPGTPTNPTSTSTATSTSTVKPTAMPTPSSTQSENPTAQCKALAASLSLRDQVGQLLMVAVPSTGVGSSAAKAVHDSRTGAVILLGNTTAGQSRILAVTKQARDAARTPKGIKILLAADQEGGMVQRLQGKGFDRIPSAQEQAQESAAELRRDATRWGKQLGRAGINANLAPVADVVPKDMQSVNQPIGLLRRGYGSNPTKVAAHVAAFVEGMDAAGIATSVKHFPGLGRVRGNTDFVARVVDDTTTRHDKALKPFAAGVDAGTDMVMVSSAYYSEIDAKRRAAFSPIVVKGMIRDDLGFEGVVISDDLAAAAMRDLAPGTRLLRFLKAGGDLAIVGDPSIVASMADAVVAEAKKDDALAAAIETAAARVLQLKDRRGLASC